MFRAFCFVCLAVLTGCIPRPSLLVNPEAAEVGEVTRVFFATAREPLTGIDFGTDRALDIRFGQIGVSVPPQHEPGRVEVTDQVPDPTRHFVAAENAAYDTDVSFRTALARDLRARPRGEREAVIFVHGFNTNFAEGVFRVAQLSHDFGITAQVIHYSWPSLGHPLGYAYDRDSALFARDGLEDLIRTVNAAGAESVVLIGHSMGAHLSMEAMRQLAIRAPKSVPNYVDGVVLISPDIDVQVFLSQTKRIDVLPDPFVIFVSKKDRALALSARLSGESNRLGNVENAQRIADLDVTVVDVSQFSQGFDLGHFTVGSSPALLSIFGQLPSVGALIAGDQSGRTGLLTGTVLTVQNATQIILSPISAISGP